MKLKPFRIEQYYDKYEFTAEYMLSSSDAQSLTLKELLDLEPEAKARLDNLWLGYTEASGAPSLRATIADIYTQANAEDVLVTAAAEEAIFIAYQALVEKDQHVIVETPCYESALELARSTGAQVSEWERHFEDGWVNDFAALERLIQPNTRLIYINTPSNPTGTLMDREVLANLIALAAEQNIIVFCDEVYRELEHDPAARLPAVTDLYTNGISLGSMSKSYGLPGLRSGWLVSRNPDLITKILDFKFYTSICNSAPSEVLSELALRHRHHLLERNLTIVHRNLPLLKAFFARYEAIFEWVEPQASPIGFPKVKIQGDVQAWCEAIVRETGVLLLPGSVYDQPQHVRIGYGRRNMPEALERLESHLQTLF